MGTRADFYIGRGEAAEWLGSIAWDGYPDGIEGAVLHATTDDAFKEAVAVFLASRGDGTVPSQGWPWPWNDSGTTDYAYAIDAGQVFASCFGGPWFLASEEQPEDEEDTSGEAASFPDMSDRKAFTLGPRSGVMVFAAR